MNVYHMCENWDLSLIGITYGAQGAAHSQTSTGSEESRRRPCPRTPAPQTEKQVDPGSIGFEFLVPGTFRALPLPLLNDSALDHPLQIGLQALGHIHR